MAFINPYEIDCECPLCHNINKVTVEFHDYLDYAFEYVKAQDAFPYLSAVEREFIISGICSECWDKLFPDEDEEEEENDFFVLFAEEDEDEEEDPEECEY